MEATKFDIIDKIKVTKISNFPLLWYLLDTTSSVNNKALKKKLINGLRLLKTNPKNFHAKTKFFSVKTRKFPVKKIKWKK